MRMLSTAWELVVVFMFILLQDLQSPHPALPQWEPSFTLPFYSGGKYLIKTSEIKQNRIVSETDCSQQCHCHYPIQCITHHCHKGNVATSKPCLCWAQMGKLSPSANCLGRKLIKQWFSPVTVQEQTQQPSQLPTCRGRHS